LRLEDAFAELEIVRAKTMIPEGPTDGSLLRAWLTLSVQDNHRPFP
jgi:hypothetical protein